MFNKKDLEIILNEWNYWGHPPLPSISRKILHQPLKLASDLVLVIQGVRRCGKSTLLTQIIEKENLNPLHCFFVNFEDPRLAENLDYKLLDEIVELAHDKNGSYPCYFFFDEIQNVKQWQKWLHSKLERPRDYFVITGSNSTLLSGEISSNLTGRHMTMELFPFDFCEYKLAKPEKIFEDYLKEGGFPRVLTHEEPEKLLREYFIDIIERDVRRYVAARSTLVLNQLVKAVFESAGSELSQRILAKRLGTTADTIGTYLDACESAYILLSCPYFTFSERQRMARNRKYYPVDLGLKKSVITKTGGDLGKDLETLVFLRLRKKYRQVFYWKEKGEVDFIVMHENGIKPYQVGWEGPKERHHLALKEFYKAYPQAQPHEFISRENIEEFLKK